MMDVWLDDLNEIHKSILNFFFFLKQSYESQEVSMTLMSETSGCLDKISNGSLRSSTTGCVSGNHCALM